MQGWLHEHQTEKLNGTGTVQRLQSSSRKEFPHNLALSANKYTVASNCLKRSDKSLWAAKIDDKTIDLSSKNQLAVFYASGNFNDKHVIVRYYASITAADFLSQKAVLSCVKVCCVYLRQMTTGLTHCIPPPTHFNFLDPPLHHSIGNAKIMRKKVTAVTCVQISRTWCHFNFCEMFVQPTLRMVWIWDARAVWRPNLPDTGRHRLTDSLDISSTGTDCRSTNASRSAGNAPRRKCWTTSQTRQERRTLRWRPREPLAPTGTPWSSWEPVFRWAYLETQPQTTMTYRTHANSSRVARLEQARV